MTVPGPYSDQTTDALLAAQGYIPGQVEQFGRILDPVRHAALRAAYECYRYFESDEEGDAIGEILAVAERFESWLARDEEGPS
jgi:hypothetical protein